MTKKGTFTIRAMMWMYLNAYYKFKMTADLEALQSSIYVTSGYRDSK